MCSQYLQIHVHKYIAHQLLPINLCYYNLLSLNLNYIYNFSSYRKVNTWHLSQ